MNQQLPFTQLMYLNLAQLVAREKDFLHGERYAL
jgi:hypothetical protein